MSRGMADVMSHGIRHPKRRLCSFVFATGFALAVTGAACNGTTGDELISFTPYASGVAGAGDAFILNGYSIQLTSAQMFIGAVYFDESPPSTSFDSSECNTSDVFAAQVAGGVSVNLLSTEPQEFSVYGNGSADVAQSWDIWLTNGDVTQENTLPTATLTGTATLVSDTSKVYSFGAIVGINPGESGAGARGTPVSDPALPGASPICKERIIQLGGLHLSFSQGGNLVVKVDPRAWFAAAGPIDFASLQPVLGANAICQLDPDSNASYESFGPCGKGSTCTAPLVCDPSTSTCTLPCGADADCSAGYVCNPADGNCITEYCIPDTNWAACPSSDPDCGVTTAASAAGEALFLGILGGGAAAYSVSYSAASSD